MIRQTDGTHYKGPSLYPKTKLFRNQILLEMLNGSVPSPAGRFPPCSTMDGANVKECLSEMVGNELE